LFDPQSEALTHLKEGIEFNKRNPGMQDWMPWESKHRQPSENEAWWTPYKPTVDHADGGSEPVGLVSRMVTRAVSPVRDAMRESKSEWGERHWYSSASPTVRKGQSLHDVPDPDAVCQVQLEEGGSDFEAARFENIKPTRREQMDDAKQKHRRELDTLAKQLGLDRDNVRKQTPLDRYRGAMSKSAFLNSEHEPYLDRVVGSGSIS